MEETLTTLLLTNSSVTGLLGDRVNWVRRPQADGTFPACVLQRVDGERQYHTKAPDGLVASRVQIDVWGETYASAKNAMRAVLAVLNGYRSGSIQGAFIETERDLPDETNDANVRLFRCSADITIWHTE